MENGFIEIELFKGMPILNCYQIFGNKISIQRARLSVISCFLFNQILN